MPPPARIHKTSKTALEWVLHLAIAEALGDSREAPWYGAWNIVLKDIIFESFCLPPLLTVTCPQFPLSKNIDTHDLEDDKIVDEDDSDDDEWDDDDDDDEESNQMTSSPQHTRILGQHSTPSPESYQSSSSPQAYRAPAYTPVRYSAPSPESHRGSSSRQASQDRSSQRRKKRSTRIPDFAQLVYKLNINHDQTITLPVIIQNSVILLVENKANKETPTMLDFGPIMRQTDQQTRRAFAMFPNVSVLGVILAIGPYWTYLEYDSANARPSPSKSELRDATYMEITPPPTESPGRFYAPIAALFAPDGFARLETDLSTEGLRLVRDRMKALVGLQTQ
jgi:hypothetical protein